MQVSEAEKIERKLRWTEFSLVLGVMLSLIVIAVAPERVIVLYSIIVIITFSKGLKGYRELNRRKTELAGRD